MLAKVVIKDIQQLNGDVPQFALLLTEVQKIPHVKLILKELSISLTVAGTSEKRTTDLIETLKRKSIPSLIIEIDHPLSYEDLNEARALFASFPPVKENSVSCLAPVSAFLSLKINKEFSQCSFVYETIEKLREHKIAGAFYSLKLQADEFTFERYTAEDVDRSIIQYKEKSRQLKGA